MIAKTALLAVLALLIGAAPDLPTSASVNGAAVHPAEYSSGVLSVDQGDLTVTTWEWAKDPHGLTSAWFADVTGPDGSLTTLYSIGGTVSQPAGKADVTMHDDIWSVRVEIKWLCRSPLVYSPSVSLTQLDSAGGVLSIDSGAITVDGT